MACCTLTPEEIAAKRVLLSEAQAAYHQLMIGGQIVRYTDQNGETISASQSSKASLYNYILTLKSELGAATGDPCFQVVTAPIGFFF